MIIKELNYTVHIKGKQNVQYILYDGGLILCDHFAIAEITLKGQCNEIFYVYLWLKTLYLCLS